MEVQNVYKILGGKPEGLGDTGADQRIVLKRILNTLLGCGQCSCDSRYSRMVA